MEEPPHARIDPRAHPPRTLQDVDCLQLLPEELLVMVCTYLGMKDNKKLRLASKVCFRAATPRVFEEITFSIQRDRIENLFSIAFDDQLARYVHTLILQPLRMFEFYDLEEFESCIDQRYSSTPPPISGQWDYTARHTFSETELERLHDSYMEDYVAPFDFQEALTSENLPETYMASAAIRAPKALCRLTNLESFLMSEQDLDLNVPSWRDLHFDGIPDDAEHDEKGAMELSCILPALSKVNRRLKTMALNTSGGGLWRKYSMDVLWGHPAKPNHRYLTKAPAAFQYYDPDHSYPLEYDRGPAPWYTHLIAESFMHLSTIYLEARELPDMSDVADGLSRLLCQAKKLQTLSLSFRLEESDPFTAWVPEQCCLLSRLSVVKFSHLKDLRLINFITSEETLFGFLNGISSTLRSLWLEDIHIKELGGSWIPLLLKLPYALSLEQIDFQELTYRPDERQRKRRLFAGHLWNLNDDIAHEHGFGSSEEYRCFFWRTHNHYEKVVEDYLLRKSLSATPPIMDQTEFTDGHPPDCEWCLEHANEWAMQKRNIRRNRSVGLH